MKDKMPDGAEGILPCSAPLANVYVPFQTDDTPKYEQRKALIRGTLFPGLDLPLKGNVNQKELSVSTLSELQAVSFVIQEIALYLDTHREDKEAVKVYRAFQELYRKAVQEYESIHGPLNHMSGNGEKYNWLDDPWPWEYAANQREV